MRWLPFQLVLFQIHKSIKTLGLLLKSFHVYLQPIAHSRDFWRRERRLFEDQILLWNGCVALAIYCLWKRLVHTHISHWKVELPRAFSLRCLAICTLMLLKLKRITIKLKWKMADKRSTKCIIFNTISMARLSQKQINVDTLQYYYKSA